ncbi:hypothetical protein N0824_00029 [Microcystis sp. 0824]|nr:hypothetical protein N0824_00029 [Microcystis sp. 0824]
MNYELRGREMGSAGAGRINKNNLLTPVSCLLSPISCLLSPVF